jgi:hypothetical protein
MARYEVIKEISDSLAGIVKAEARRQKFDLEVVLGPFDTAFFGRRSNAVAIYLYELSFDHQKQQESREFQVESEDADGPLTVHYPRPLVVDLRYAVAATGKTSVDEQLSLTVALKAFFDHPVLSGPLRLGDNFPERDLPVDLDPKFNLEAQARLLASLGVSHHALLGYRITTEVKPERELRRTRKVERRTIDIFDRHHAPPGKGLDADRSRPAAAAKGRK